MVPADGKHSRLEAGAVCVPWDLTGPTARSRRIVEQVNTKHIIVTPEVVSQAIQLGLDYTVVDLPWLQRLYDHGKQPTSTKCLATDIARAIFTSGTTSELKGVLE